MTGVIGPPEEWQTRESAVVGPCMACAHPAGLVLVRGDVRLCFTCVVEAGKAAVIATGFVRPKRGGTKDR